MNKQEFEQYQNIYKGKITYVRSDVKLDVNIQLGLGVVMHQVPIKLEGVNYFDSLALNTKSAKKFLLNNFLNKEVYIRVYKSKTAKENIINLAEIYYEREGSNEIISLNEFLIENEYLEKQEIWE